MIKFALTLVSRREEEAKLTRMLKIAEFQLKIRGDPRPASNVAIDILYQEEPERKEIAQITFVKTRAEAEKLAAKWKVSLPMRVVLLRHTDQVKCHHSKLSSDDKAHALTSLAAGHPIVATYGLAVGMNLKVQGQPVKSVDTIALPWSVASFAHVVGRIRNAGKVRTFIKPFDQVRTGPRIGICI